MITVTPNGKKNMKTGIVKEPEVYHFMPECQNNDYQGNNYIRRACKDCCLKYSKEVAKHGGIDVYANNVLTSQGSDERPRFLDEHDSMGYENPPRGLPLEDFSGMRKRERQQRVHDLTVRPKAANPPKASSSGHWSEPTRQQMMEERFQISFRHRTVPGPVASEVDTTDWDHITEQERRDMDEVLLEHLRDADGVPY